MAGINKILKKMRSRPNEIRFKELIKVLNEYGYNVVRINGFHYHFRNKTGDLITIPDHGDPVKTAYVKDVLRRIGI